MKKSPKFLTIISAVVFSFLEIVATAQNSGSPFQARVIEESLQIPREQQKVVIGVAIRIPPEHYLYVDKTDLQIDAPNKLTVGALQAPPHVVKDDPYLKKKIKIFPAMAGGKEELLLTREITLPSFPAKGMNASIDYDLKLTVRYQGCNPKVCFLPTTQEWTVKLRQGDHATNGPLYNENVTTTLWDFNRQASRGVALLLLLAFVGGVLSSLTPCVYPMIPITIAVIGAKQARSKLQSLKIGAVFALGLALTYAVLGVVAASSGNMLGAALQNRWLVGGIALVFIAMGLSMFGWIEFRLPYQVNQWVARAEGKEGFLGVGITGMITGLVAAPCVGPVVVGILGYVATQGNPLLGFTLLFVFALGLSTLFVVLGVFTSLLGRLPKSGVWMDKVKGFLGIVLIAVGIYYLLPVLKPIFDKNQKSSVLSSGIQWQDDLDAALKSAKEQQRPVMVDFYADWCLACKELDAETYSDSQVIELAKQIVSVKLDFTTGDIRKQQLLERYKIIGLPSIQFFNANGEWLANERVDGFIGPELMRAKLQRLSIK